MVSDRTANQRKISPAAGFRGKRGCPLCSIRAARYSFSLMELVVVIVIIGIIAAVAIPRLSRGVVGADETALQGDLAALRQAIDVYAAEHHGVFPGANPDGAGNGADSAGAFVTQMTGFTDENGEAASTPDATHRFGPYLRAIPPLPVGANKGSTAVAIDAANSPPLVTTGTEGWVCNTQKGEIIANSDDANRDGTRAYDEY